MSLILEALKKSEQQRRLGEAPTLGSPVVATRRRRSLLPVLVVLILGAAVAGWWLTRKAPPPPSATSTPAPMETTQAPTPAAPSKNVPTPTASANDRAQDRPRLTGYATALQKAEQEKRAAALANPTHAKTPAPSSAPLKPGDAQGVAPAPAPSLAASSSTAEKSTTADTARTAVTAPSAASAAVPPNTKAGNSTAPAATASATKPTAEGAALPTVWELPFATRKELPAIDLSMHVYSADPKQRFVVIKGDRHVEGDEVGQDLVLREIRQDGLVLEYKGQTFFFPRSGR